MTKYRQKTQKVPKLNSETMLQYKLNGIKVPNTENLRKAIHAYLEANNMPQYRFQEELSIAPSVFTNILKVKAKYIKAETAAKLMSRIRPYFERFERESELRIQEESAATDEARNFYKKFITLDKKQHKEVIIMEMVNEASPDVLKKHIYSLYSTLDKGVRQKLELTTAKAMLQQAKEVIKDFSKSSDAEGLKEIETTVKPCLNH